MQELQGACPWHQVPLRRGRKRDHSTENRTLKEELIAERQAPMGGRRERAGGNLGPLVHAPGRAPPTKAVGGGSLKKQIHILDRLGWPARVLLISHPARARLPPKAFSFLGFAIPR